MSDAYLESVTLNTICASNVLAEGRDVAKFLELHESLENV